MKRIGAILFWVGLVITIASVAVTIFSGLRAFDTLSSGVDGAGPMPNGSATVDMGEGELRTIFEDTSSGAASAVCEVSGPEGNMVPLESAQDFGAAEDFGGTSDGVSYAEVGSFESTQAGQYQVDCSGGTTLIGPSIDIDELGSGALGVVGGILGVGLGLLLLVIGAVLWFVGRSRAKKAATSGPGGPYGQGGYSQGGYNQGGYGGPPPPPGANPAQQSPSPYSDPPEGNEGPPPSGYGSTPPPPPPPRS